MLATDQDTHTPRFIPSSAVLRIQSSKLKSAGNNLKLYRVLVSTQALTTLMTKLGAGNQDERSSKLKDTHSIWVPAPILEHSLPAMVAEYNQSAQSESGAYLAPQALEPVCTFYFVFVVIVIYSLDLTGASPSMAVSTSRLARQLITVCCFKLP